MQIRMLDTWAYDVVPGQIRRTLPAGQTFDEPVEIAQAAIDAGAAERLVAMAPIVDDVDLVEVDADLESGDGDQDDGEPGSDSDGDDPGDAGPAPVPATPEPAPAKPGRGRTPVAAIPAPAEPVEPV